MRTLIAIVTAAVVGLASAAQAQRTDDQKCHGWRQRATAKHQQKQQAAMTRFILSNWLDGDGAVTDRAFMQFQEASRKSTRRYAKTWTKLQRIPVAPCNLTRFVDNGDGTVTDNLSGLVWEKKDNHDGVWNLSNPHDADNGYTWSAGPPYIGNGTAYTTFLTGGLNTPGFAGANDWRLPTWIELAGIRNLHPTEPTCANQSCIDAIFGPTMCCGYWSSATVVHSPETAGRTDYAWSVHNAYHGWIHYGSVKTFNKSVRAVRGGL